MSGPEDATSPLAPAPEAPAQRPPSREWIAGLVLIGIGVLLLAGRFVPDMGEYVVLVIGLGLLAIFAVTRSYGALIPGGIVSGIGLGIVVQQAVGADTGAGLFLLAMGGGFVAIWLLALLFRLPENHWWPLIPGGIIGLVGAVRLVGPQGHDLLAYGPPLILVALGAVLVARALLQRGGSA